MSSSKLASFYKSSTHQNVLFSHLHPHLYQGLQAILPFKIMSSTASFPGDFVGRLKRRILKTAAVNLTKMTKKTLQGKQNFKNRVKLLSQT